MNPLITIWYKTSKTFDSLLNEKQNHLSYYWIFYLVFLSDVISKTATYSDTENIGIIGIIIGHVIGLFLAGFLLQFPMVYLFEITGKILQGKANRQQIRLIFAYSLLPFLFHLLITLISLTYSLTTNSNYENIGSFNNFTNIIVYLIFLKIIIIGLSKTQKFSYGYAVLNFFIPTTILGSLLYLIKIYIA